MSEKKVSQAETSTDASAVQPKITRLKSLKTLPVGQLQFHSVNLQQASQVIRYWADVADSTPFRYVVTPNIDHMARLVDPASGDLLSIYQQADLLLCDSRVLQKLIHSRLQKTLPVVAGSDLTDYLFQHALQLSDRIAIIGGDDAVIERVRQKYDQLTLMHINPSMGFIHKQEEVDTLIEWVKQQNPHFLFLALGSPQQEKLATAFKASECHGVALCIGASIRFLVGDEVRAPVILQRLHLEWLFRMLQSPKRLIPRYLGNFLAIPKVWRFMKQSDAPISQK